VEILRDGKFTFTIDGSHLMKGIRPSVRSPRNMEYLSRCIGAVGRDGILQALDDISSKWLDLHVTITDSFPYPQLFVFTNFIIICGQTWSAVDFYDYVYLSNSKVSVVRDAGSGVYSLSSALPEASAICNFNGQVLIGAPDEVV
jgi:hypothetical protein